ncbi:MAG: C39 family peptidase [Nocardioidaceae bacterium]
MRPGAARRRPRWCSPTGSSSNPAYGPSPADYADIPYDDPQVDYAAANTYDYNYDGTGNWPFNTAYAGRYDLESFVTRLRSLTEAEQFIKAGIPLVVSVSFKKGELERRRLRHQRPPDGDRRLHPKR